MSSNGLSATNVAAIVRERDETFAHADFSDVVRAVDAWANTQRIACHDIIDWDLDTHVASATCGGSLLVYVTGSHPLALSERLAIEIDTVYAEGDDGDIITVLDASVVAIPVDLVQALYCGERTYNVRHLARVAPDDLAPNVNARARSLVRAWAAHM